MELLYNLLKNSLQSKVVLIDKFYFLKKVHVFVVD